MKPVIGLIIKERGNFALQKRFAVGEPVIDKTMEEVEHHEHALVKAGYRVRRLYWGASIIAALKKGGFDLVFNVSSLAEAAVLEDNGIPYVGSDVFAISAAADKSLAKRLWQHAGLPTAPFATFRSEADCDRFLQLPTLAFPLFLKPLAGRGSAGISPTSIVDTPDALRSGVIERLRSIGQPVMAEPYLRGREITIGVLGNEAPRALPPLEIVYRDGDRTLTFEKKERDDDVFFCPALLSDANTKALQELAVRAYQTLGFRDYGRIDLILTEKGPFLLEGNTFAGLMCQPREKPHSYIGFMAVAAGLDGPKLLDQLVKEAWQRTVA